MKVTIVIDCTPDEARQFFGLPDVKPMQAVLMARMEARMAEATERFSPEALWRSWMTLMPQTSDQMTDVVAGFFRAAGSSPRKDNG